MARNQLFVIPEATLAAMKIEDVRETTAAMLEFGIYKLPYDKVDLRLSVKDKVKIDHAGSTSENLKIALARGQVEKDATGAYFLTGDCGLWLELTDCTVDGFGSGQLVATSECATYRPFTLAITKYVSWDRAKTYIDALIVLLATRNAVKTTTRDKLAALGIGKNKGRHRHEYVTTITLPQEREDDADNPAAPGKPKAPHLRRGHIRRQHYGPRNTLVRQIWIEPVFVNADKDWTDTRTRYNVSL